MSENDAKVKRIDLTVNVDGETRRIIRAYVVGESELTALLRKIGSVATEFSEKAEKGANDD